jgi:hypothetical protein
VLGGPFGYLLEIVTSFTDVGTILRGMAADKTR